MDPEEYCTSLSHAASCEALRKAYIEEMKKHTADDLVFPDEAIFNEKTGWRHPGMDHRANASNTSLIPLGAILMRFWQRLHLMAGYPVQFYQFIIEFLIPCLKETYGDTEKVIIMDNVQIHCDERSAMLLAGYIAQYIPPCSPDFNPIELSFSVIKVCITRHVLGCVNIVGYWRGSSGISYIFAICIQISKPFYGWQLFAVVVIDLHALNIDILRA